MGSGRSTIEAEDVVTESVRHTHLEVLTDPAVRHGGFSKAGCHLDFPIGVFPAGMAGRGRATEC